MKKEEIIKKFLIEHPNFTFESFKKVKKKVEKPELSMTKRNIWARSYFQKRRKKDKYYIFCRKKYRMLRRQAGGSLTIKEWNEVKRKQKYKCKICKKIEPQIKLTIDHIIPVTKWKEWSIKNSPKYLCSDKENIQGLCLICNIAKGNKLTNS